MGDRVSVQFALEGSRGEKEESVVLFSHWGGRAFAREAEKYARSLLKKRKGEGEPLDRFEPNTVMVDFIRHVTKDMKVVSHDLYLGRTEEDGDNSDNGNVLITFKIKEDGTKVLELDGVEENEED